MKERAPSAGGALRFTAGDAWFLVVATLALVASHVTAVTSDGPHHAAALTVGCVDLVFGGAIAAASVTAALELVELLAGRGRHFPLAGQALPAARWLLVLAAGASIAYVRGPRAPACLPFAAPFPGWALERDPVAMAALACVAALLPRALARATGASLLVPLAVGASAGRGLAELQAFEAGSDSLGASVPAVAELANAIAPLLGALAAARSLRPEDARRLGITAWAKDDLALAPLALVYGGAALYELVVAAPGPRTLPYLVADDLRDAPYVGLPALVFACGAILTLGRWARSAAAHANTAAGGAEKERAESD